MNSLLSFWGITSIIILTIEGVSSSQDKRRQLCVPSVLKESHGVIPKTDYACRENYGILVDEISMAMVNNMKNIWLKEPEALLDDKCKDDNSTYFSWSTPLHNIKDLRNHSQEIEIRLLQACNGKRRCHLSLLDLPSPIPIPSTTNEYFQTYIIKYQCLPQSQDKKHKGTFIDFSKDEMFQMPAQKTIFSIRSSKPFDKECAITASEGEIIIDPLWISYNTSALVWDVCFQVYRWNWSVYDIGCAETDVRTVFQHDYSVYNKSVTFRVSGDGGFAWIQVSATSPHEINCTTSSRDVSSPGQPPQLCIPSHYDESASIPEFNVCPNHYGILVTSIQMNVKETAGFCYGIYQFPSVELFHNKDYRARGYQIQLALKQACNGNTRCSFINGFLPSPIPALNSGGTYKTYVVTYRCEPLSRGGPVNDDALLSMTETFTLQRNDITTLIVQSPTQFNRECEVQAPGGTIYLELLWLGFQELDKRWQACVKFYHKEVKVFEVGCNKTAVGRTFSNMYYPFTDGAKIHVTGESGFVWIQTSANGPYRLSCTQKHPDQLVTTVPPTKESKIQTTSAGDKTQTNDLTSITYIKEYSDSPSTIIAITSTIAVLATVTAIGLVIYVCYIRKGSAYQRRKFSKRLERQLTQRMQEGQHPRMQSPSQRSRQQRQQQQQEQQQQANGEAPYDMYTYLDARDVKGSPKTPIKDRPRIPLPGISPKNNNTYCTAKFVDKTGAYSDNYGFVQTSNTNDEEYNRLGSNNSTPVRCNGHLYDAGPSGAYSHFNDVNKKNKIVGNLYDG